MKSFLDFHKKMEHFLRSSWEKIHYRGLPYSFVYFLLFSVNPFWIHLSYFIILTLVGFLVLKVLGPSGNSFRPKDLDIFFTSVSAGTVSSMATVEMEAFSGAQLVIMTLLMFAGGEVFTSLLELQLEKFQFNRKKRIEDDSSFSNTSASINAIELGLVNNQRIEYDQKLDAKLEAETNSIEGENFRLNCIRTLALIVLCYLIVIHAAGSTLISLYISLIPSARQVLKEKGLSLQIFSALTTVSTFANGGFVPTNENMMVFKKNSGLLLILIPQVLLGNTLYPACLNLIIWVLQRITKQARFTYMLENPGKLEYCHFFPGLRSVFLAITVVGFIMVQFVLFCSLEWHSEATSGLNAYEKLVASLFQVVNCRHTGDSVFDLTLLNPAILVVFIVMMYFPPYTSFLPVKDDKDVVEETKNRKRRKNYLQCLFFSPLSYLVIFIVLVCITERDKMKEDPINFNVLNIVLEVISAYGNVGFSTGYSCGRQIKPDGHCKDAWFGFVGRWSNKGKFILVLVMFFGRLKKFSLRGGKAWKLA